MSDTGARPPSPQPTPDDRGANLKAAVLIGVAVLIGFVFLLKGFSQEGGVVDTGASGSDRATSTTATTAASVESTTTTTAQAKPPAEVAVMVANGSGKAGVAGSTASKLKSAGYTKVDTVNANVVSKSSVYFAPGAEGDAAAVAKALGIDAAAVAALPSPPPADPKGATVLVVIGPDKA